MKKIRKLSKSQLLNKDKLLEYGSPNHSLDLNNKNSKSNLFVLKKKYENKFKTESVRNSLISLEERLDNTLLRLVHFKPVYNTHREGLISNENNSKLFEKLSFQVRKNHQKSKNRIKKVKLKNRINKVNLTKAQKKRQKRRKRFLSKRFAKKLPNRRSLIKNIRFISIGKKSGKKFGRRFVLKRRA